MRFRSILDALRSIPPLRRGGAAGRRAAFRPRLESLDVRWVPSFNPAVHYAVGDYPLAVATGHFNNDAVLDVVVADYGTSQVSVLLGNGDGTFQPAMNSDTGTNPISVAVGDFDGDTNLDVATANVGDVSVLLGNDDGTFAAPTSVPLSGGSNPQSASVGDFNADGKLDLGVAGNYYNPGYYYTGYYGGLYWHAGYYTGNAHVLIGDGLGGMSDVSNTATGYGYYWSGAVADFNGDSKLDFAAAGVDNWAVTVLMGDGAGNLSWGTNASTNAPPLWVAVGDANGDGELDLVTAKGWYNNVSVMWGNGLGGFGSAKTYSAGGSYPASVALADFNQDGRADIAAANNASGTLTVVLGRVDGTFSPPIPSPAGSLPWDVTVGDFNGDGWADAATADSGGDDASVLLNDHIWPASDAPSVFINDISVTEGIGIGSVNATFTLTLSAAYGQPVTVHFATADGSAGSSDYAIDSADVTIPAGVTTKTFTVAVLGDRLPEPTENFVVNLSGPTNGFIGDSQGFVTILDNEPRIFVNDVTVTEGNTGSLDATVKVNLSVAYDEPVTVHFVLADGSALVGSDYTAGSGYVTVAAGQTSQTFTVAVLGDVVSEPTEYFLVNLSSPSSNSLITDSQGVVSIIDNEPRISINDVSKKEGNGKGTTAFVFTVSLLTAYDQVVTVKFATADGTATLLDNDYQAASGTVTFAPGEITKTFTVSVTRDKKSEPNQWFAVNLSSASVNALISDPQGIGWIINDDH